MKLVAANSWVDELAQQHLDAAYNLGRWLLGNDQDAADAVHDAYVRAVRSAHTYAGGNARSWWLAIVRNSCFSALKLRRREVPRGDTTAAIDELLESDSVATSSVEMSLDAAQRSDHINEHLRALPVEYREVLVLREIEDMSYREIADVLAVPIGTVMSRLSRGRALLQKAMTATIAEAATHGL